MSHPLATFLEVHRAELVEKWLHRVTGQMNPEHSPRSEIIDSLPVFLTEMVGKLREGAGADVLPSASAPQHGAMRFHAGFSLGTVVREYRALQDCILDLVKERSGPASVDEIQAVVNCISTAVADAVQEFTKVRDAAILREKDQHFAFLAHELRNPLSSALFALELMRRKAAAPPPPEADRALSSLERLRKLIDEAVLDVRVRSLGADFPLRKERLSVPELVQEMVAESAGDAEGKQITLTCESSERVRADAVADGDRRLLCSAIGNLVRNAVKFTAPHGKVMVEVQMGEGRVSVQVEDRCGGLPDGKVEDLFTPYVQRGRDRTGFGLGLAIAKQAVEAHGGTIQVRNLPGTGCIFMFDLPLAS